MIAELLALGADPAAVSKVGENPLQTALAFGHLGSARAVAACDGVLDGDGATTTFRVSAKLLVDVLRRWDSVERELQQWQRMPTALQDAVVLVAHSHRRKERVG